MNETAQQKQKLEQALWDIANTLRGKMHADEYRHYILGLIFYKFLSDQIRVKANEWLKADNRTFETLQVKKPEDDEFINQIREMALSELGYALEPKDLFVNIAERGANGDFVLDDLSDVLTRIQNSTMGNDSEEEFENLFEDMDLTSTKLGKTPEQRNANITRIMSSLGRVDFGLDKSEGDILGDAYEYLIGYFASSAGKKAGEFYTPQQVSTILARIVSYGKTKLRSVYDPTCGSGSLLLRVARELKGTVGMFYGQEMNPTTYNLARMNMIMHNIHFNRFNIVQGDTLEHPGHLDIKMEAIVANPPFSAHWNNNESKLQDERWAQYGNLAPAKKADFAFITHMLHHLDDNGTMAVVLPHGVLFRGAKEGKIREFLLKEKNVLDAVIGLPANIFYGTSIPTSILVFKNCREHKDVLFVDGSKFVQKGKNQNWLSPEDIDTIVSAYTKRQDVDKVARRVSFAEIEANDFNLNIPRYIDTFEAAEDIDINAVADRLATIQSDMTSVDAEIQAFCKELDVRAPV